MIHSLLCHQRSLFYYTKIEEQALENECTCVIFISYIINFFQAMTIVAATLVDLVRNLKAFAGILIVSTHIYMYL